MAGRAVSVVLEGTVATPSPGWWVCSTCGRRGDRDGDQARVRVCAGRDGLLHSPTSMTVQR